MPTKGTKSKPRKVKLELLSDNISPAKLCSELDVKFTLYSPPPARKDVRVGINRVQLPKSPTIKAIPHPWELSDDIYLKPEVSSMKRLTPQLQKQPKESKNTEATEVSQKKKLPSHLQEEESKNISLVVEKRKKFRKTAKKVKRPPSPIALSEDEERYTGCTAEILPIGPELFDDPLKGPPYPKDLTELIKSQTTAIFRVLCVFKNGMISLRSHSQLAAYLFMDATLQKFYKDHEIKLTFKISSENLIEKGYYVVALGGRYERCQFIEYVISGDNKSIGHRIRLLDSGFPVIVPISVLRPMHYWFKILRAQGYTAELYDPGAGMTKAANTPADNQIIRKQCQDKIFDVKVFLVDLSYPECPHIHFRFEPDIFPEY